MPYRDSRVPCRDFRVPYRDSRVPYRDPIVPYRDSRAPYRDSRVPYIDSRVPYRDSRVPYRDFRVPYTDFRVPCRDPRVPYRDSRAPYRDSRVPYIDSRVPYRDPRMPYRDSVDRFQWPMRPIQGLVTTSGVVTMLGEVEVWMIELFLRKKLFQFFATKFSSKPFSITLHRNCTRNAFSAFYKGFPLQIFFSFFQLFSERDEICKKEKF